MPRSFLLILAVAALLRAPFLNHAIQGDDYYYLAGAQHAQIDPLHPHHARYVFMGMELDMRGHSHPPGNAWLLGAILAVTGDIAEVPFHVAYCSFSLLAACAVWSLARRFVPERATEATLLFLAIPAFVVNGNSLEADLPFLAFWLASTAAFAGAVERRSGLRLAGSAILLAATALCAYQSVVLVPVLGYFLWQRQRQWRIAWLVVLIPPLTLLAWQAMEWVTSGAPPVSVLAGHMQQQGFQRLEAKLKSAAALLAHLAWMICPLLAVVAFRRVSRTVLAIVAVAALGAGWAYDWHPLFWVSFGIGLLIAIAVAARWREWESAWLLLFLGAALVLFFAGSARYLLPLGAPLAFLVARELRDRPLLLRAGFAFNLVLGLAMATANYQHWEGYRDFAKRIAGDIQSRRTWINGEWGLRFYTEAEGALALVRGKILRPGQALVSMQLDEQLPFTAGGGQLVRVAEATIQPTVPLRLIGLGTRSGYSSVGFGVRPFDFGAGPADRVWLSHIAEHKPELTWLPMNAPDSDAHIISGIYQLEENRWRWATSRAMVALKSPAEPKPLAAEVYIPDASPVRKLTLQMDGKTVAELVIPKPGLFQVTAPPHKPAGETATLTLLADADFSPPRDNRRLSLVLTGIGFRE